MLPSAPSSSVSFRDLLRHSLNPHIVDFWSTKLNPLWAMGQPVGKIVARQHTAKDTVTLTLKTNRVQAMPQAGQHLMVGAVINGIRVARSYSSSVVAGRRGLLEITVKQMPGGRLSQWLCQQARVGDVLFLGAPFGSLHWPSQQPVVMLAAGSGITPMISLLRQHVAQASRHQQPVQLYYWVGLREEACFVDELLRLQASHANFSFSLYLTRQQPEQRHEAAGRIDVSTCSQLGQLASSQVLACGSAGFVATAQHLLQARVAAFQAEAFSPPVPVTTADDPAVDQPRVQITLKRQQRVLTVPVGQSILSLLEAEGIAHPSGCRMGLCNTCACVKLSGSTQHLMDGRQQHDADSALRVCVHSARSHLVLDI